MYTKIDPAKLYFGHFGISDEPSKALTEVRKWLNIFTETAWHIYQKYESIDNRLSALTEALKEEVLLSNKQLTGNKDFLRLLGLDMKVSAMGLIDYIEKNRVQKDV